MRQTIFKLSLSVLLVAAGSVAQAQLLGNYSTATGELSFAYGGAEGNLAGIRINSSSSGLLDGRASDLGGAIVGPLSVINDQAPNFIEWGNLVGFNFSDAGAGAVLPAGLDQAGLDSGYELLYRALAEPTVDIAGVLTCADCVSGIVPTPAPGDLDLGQIVLAGGLIEDAITFAGGDPTAVDFSNQSIPGLFFANIDGSSVDIGVDVALATTFPANTVATADLSVSGAGGPFNFAVSAIVPEPTTIGLAGFALVGLVGARRRS